jgi:hypothetical protein
MVGIKEWLATKGERDRLLYEQYGKPLQQPSWTLASPGIWPSPPGP